MDIGGGRSVCLLVILGIIIHCVASDNQVCRIEERLNMGLSKIDDPSTILSVSYDYRSAPDCYHACCNYTGNQCNAVSYYATEYLCMLLSCRPFKNCIWVAADGFTAARTQLTTVAVDAPPPPPPSPSISQQMTTSQQNPDGLTMSQGLAEGVTPTTTTTTQATPTTTPTPSSPGGLEPTVTQPLNVVDTSSNSAQASPLPDGTNSSEVSDWNMVDSGNDIPTEEAIQSGVIPTVNPESAERTTTAAIPGIDTQPDDQQQQQSIGDWQPSNVDAPAPSNPDDESSFEEPVFTPEEDPNARPREMKRMFIQSPGIIIGLCSALGVAFLVLLAVCRKVYLSHDRPRYKPLRDYDIRFEPPAASSALLP